MVKHHHPNFAASNQPPQQPICREQMPLPLFSTTPRIEMPLVQNKSSERAPRAYRCSKNIKQNRLRVLSNFRELNLVSLCEVIPLTTCLNLPRKEIRILRAHSRNNEMLT